MEDYIFKKIWKNKDIELNERFTAGVYWSQMTGEKGFLMNLCMEVANELKYGEYSKMCMIMDFIERYCSIDT